MAGRRFLSPEQARATYDRVGRLQDTQGFYERAAVDRMVAAGDFAAAHSVVEAGCGTGALAGRLLAGELPGDAQYCGLDLSPRMVELTRRRLASWADRAEVRLVDGTSPWPVQDAVADRVVATYVLDLLSPAATRTFWEQAARVLTPSGTVCLTSLTPGTGALTRVVSGAWSSLWRVSPRLTAGCRPVDLQDTLPAGWTVRTLETVAAFGVSSQVLVAGRD